MTIYLAAGAPFGVSAYLHAQMKRSGRLRKSARAVAATLFWPLAVIAILFRPSRPRIDDGAVDNSTRMDALTDEATRALLGSVQKVLELARSRPVAKREAMERTLYALRESVEQYVGLARGASEEDFDSTPVKREMELNRIAGRRGDDLIIAGRCVHRRNVARLIARRRRARTRLLHALAELREEEAVPDGGVQGHVERRREMSEARLELYNRAVDLLSLLDDTSAVACAARLMDAECSLLRRLQASHREQEQSDPDEAHASACVEETCTEHRPQLIFNARPRETTFTRG